ncbi:MAG TPA: cation-efflux pump [Acidobacteriaceae bacterium]|nr:cation-efflux pump [Acidobacteriaceae bacterium]
MARSNYIASRVALDASAKKQAATISVLAASMMVALKLWTGLQTGSIGVLSEAVHSGLDLVASILILASVSVSDRPADDTHAYGHGKIENLAAFTETLLMIASVLWILTEAAERILGHAVRLKLSVWPFAVLLLSMAVDLMRSRALGRVARQTHSQALEADALHFSMDIWSSLAVIGGLLAGFAAQYWHLEWLRFGDPLAALVVSIIIFKVCWKLARQTVDVLTDAAPIETRRRVAESVRRLPNVLGIERVRLRLSGNHYFADLTVGMPRNLSFQSIERIKEQVASAVHRILPDADVVVNVVPRAQRSESIFDRVRAVAARHNLSVHDLSVQHYDAKLHLEQHLEVPESLSLREAHALVTAIETETRAEVPEIDTILTHIESERSSIELEARRSEDAALETQLRGIVREFPDILDVHDVVVSNARERMQVSCHCTLPDDRSMAEVHALITALEDRVKSEMPQIARVFIHPEPATDNRR